MAPSLTPIQLASPISASAIQGPPASRSGPGASDMHADGAAWPPKAGKSKPRPRPFGTRPSWPPPTPDSERAVQ
jgi:hypothetical protein